MRFLISFLVFYLSIAAPFASATDAEYNSAVQMIQNKKFDQALPILLKLANEGDRDAQNNLGAMYQHGHGVSINLGAAAHWYLLSAKKGNNVAEYNIGIAYFNGQGLPQNKIEGLAWMLMSVWSGLDQSESVASLMKSKMSEQQISKAVQRLMVLNNKFGIFTDTPPPFEK